jgi:hypothetical protein
MKKIVADGTKYNYVDEREETWGKSAPGNLS